MVQHIADDELSRYASETGDRASGTRIRAHVMECADCEKRLIDRVIARLDQVVPHDHDRRRARKIRELASGSALIQKLSPFSCERLKAEILDSSPNGFGLAVPEMLEPGTIVSLRYGTLDVVATVCHCKPTEEGAFRAGVQIRRHESLYTPSRHWAALKKRASFA